MRFTLKNSFPLCDNCRRAVSLPEIVIVLAILGSLLVLSVPTYEKVQEKMKKVVCISRMKRIYHALNDYVQENGYWPQPPEGEGFMDEEEEWRWWISDHEGLRGI